MRLLERLSTELLCSVFRYAVDVPGGDIGRNELLTRLALVHPRWRLAAQKVLFLSAAVHLKSRQRAAELAGAAGHLSLLLSNVPTLRVWADLTDADSVSLDQLVACLFKLPKLVAMHLSFSGDVKWAFDARLSSIALADATHVLQLASVKDLELRLFCTHFSYDVLLSLLQACPNVSDLALVGTAKLVPNAEDMDSDWEDIESDWDITTLKNAHLPKLKTLRFARFPVDWTCKRRLVPYDLLSRESLALVETLYIDSIRACFALFDPDMPRLHNCRSLTVVSSRLSATDIISYLPAFKQLKNVEIRTEQPISLLTYLKALPYSVVNLSIDTSPAYIWNGLEPDYIEDLAGENLKKVSLLYVLPETDSPDRQDDYVWQHPVFFDTKLDSECLFRDVFEAMGIAMITNNLGEVLASVVEKKRGRSTESDSATGSDTGDDTSSRTGGLSDENAASSS